MEQEALVAAIALICKFSDPKISREKKEICMEKIVNCAIGRGGETNFEKLEKCAKKIED